MILDPELCIINICLKGFSYSQLNDFIYEKVEIMDDIGNTSETSSLSSIETIITTPTDFLFQQNVFTKKILRSTSINIDEILKKYSTEDIESPNLNYHWKESDDERSEGEYNPEELDSLFNKGSETRKKQNVLDKEKKAMEKQAIRLKKMEERERKRHETKKNQELKNMLASSVKNLKPEESLKLITVYIDDDILQQEYGSEIIANLQTASISYIVETHIFPKTILWKRKVQSHLSGENGQLSLSSDITEVEEMILLMSWKEFIQYVNDKALITNIGNMCTILEQKNIFLVIFGLERYFRFQRYQKNRNFAAELAENKSKISKDHKIFQDVPKVSRRTVEYALTELQLSYSCCHRFVETNEDIALLIIHFTKSIANKPYKLGKQKELEQSDLYVSGDNTDVVSIDKMGNGLSRLWNQILTTFPLASLETAEAISSRYPTPICLIQAYENCQSVSEGEQLLQDIPIRRAAGPLTSLRKIGPEMSKKIYNYFLSTDGDDNF